MSPALRALCSQPVPLSVQHVTMALLASSEAKIAFHLVRHALGIVEWSTAVRVDLQRMQLLAQWLATVEAYPAWFEALKHHSLAVLLFPQLAAIILQATNQVRGRTASASRRNALAHYGAVALAVFRWLHVPESLRQPLLDWQAKERALLERATRVSRREQRQALLLEVAPSGGGDIASNRATNLSLANSLSIEGVPSSRSCIDLD
jgi:hypothetical protein